MSEESINQESPDDEFDAVFDEITNETDDPVEAGESSSESADGNESPDLLPEPDNEEGAGEHSEDTKESEPVSESISEIDPDKIQQERDSLLQYKRSNEGRVSALQQKINSLEQQLVAPPKPTEPPPANTDVTPEQWSNFEEEYPEIAKAINARMTTMEQSVSRTVEGQIGQVVQPLQNAERERFLQSQVAALDAAYPDWQEIVRSEPFTQWLSAQPTAVQKFMESEDARDASFLLDTYEHSKPQPNRELAAADPKVAEIQAQREKKLKESQGIKSRPTPGATGGMPDDFDSAFDHFVRQKERVSR